MRMTSYEINLVVFVEYNTMRGSNEQDRDRC